MILGIDTSLGTAVAAVEEDGEILADLSSTNPLGHAEVIGDLLVETLSAVPEAPVTAVAAGMGPGPFTGLRVGIAAARTFALGRGVPMIPVVSHDAAALEVLLHDALRGQDTTRFAIVTDARRREFAVTIYDGLDDDGLPIRAVEPFLVPRDDVDARLHAEGATRRDTAAVSATMIGICAARAVRAGRVIGPDDALYLRSPDVTLPGARKKVGA